jgi:hypothetical protein
MGRLVVAVVTMHFLLFPALAAGDLPARRFAVVFHVARNDERAGAAIDRWMAVANRLFGEHGICFEETDRRTLPPERAQLSNISDRRRLRGFLVDRAIDVFAVDAILDPVPSRATARASSWMGRTPSGRLAGAHIPAPGHRPGTYVILALTAGETTLAHELGHVFGAGHHRDPENIMSYGPARRSFDGRQVHAFVTRAARLAHRREVRVVDDRCEGR